MSQTQEKQYLAALLDTGLRVGEARTLTGKNVFTTPAQGVTFGHLRVLEGKPPSSKRNVSSTKRANTLLRARIKQYGGAYPFPGDGTETILGTSLIHQHNCVRDALKLPKDFVIHSLRPTMLTRLGEAGANAFIIYENCRP